MLDKKIQEILGKEYEYIFNDEDYSNDVNMIFNATPGGDEDELIKESIMQQFDITEDHLVEYGNKITIKQNKIITVDDLIKELNKYDKDLRINVNCDNENLTIDGITQDYDILDIFLNEV